jgi:prepilin signal peptidase PulO-like enzyme (type II secretory pathway)
MRAVRFLFGVGMGAEYMDPEEETSSAAPAWFGRRWLSWVQRVGGKALGIGDADLMMMAGAFLGWQPTVVSFGLGTIAGLVLSAGQMLTRRSNVVAFGPGLAVGIVITTLGWPSIEPRVRELFFSGPVLGILAGVCVVSMFVGGYLVRLVRLVFHR